MKTQARKHPARPARPARPAPPRVAAKPMLSWLHVAALNLIADHEAGIIIGATNLAAARKLVAGAVS